MAIILPPKGNAGAGLGASLGTGLGNALQSLGQGYEQNQKGKALEQAGLPAILSQLDPQVQAAYLKEYGAAQQGAKAQDFNRILEETLQGSPSKQADSISERFKVEEGPRGVEASEQVKISEPSQTIETRLQSDIKKINDRLSDPNLDPSVKEKLRERRDNVEDRLEKRAASLNKETKEFFQRTTKEARAAKGNDKRLSRMKTLIDRGNLSNPTFAAGLETLSKGIFGFGIDLFNLTNPDSQEFRKLSTDFIKEAKDTFGSRLTDTDVKTFLQTVPTLSQDDEGKKRVIANLENFNEAAKVRQQAMDDIIEANGGIRPRNLESLVEKKAADQLDKLAEEFKRIESNENAPPTREEAYKNMPWYIGRPY